MGWGGATVRWTALRSWFLVAALAGAAFCCYQAFRISAPSSNRMFIGADLRDADLRGQQLDRHQFDGANLAGADLREKCLTLGPGEPMFASMNITAPATSTESLDFSRQGILRNSCFSRSSGVCEAELEKMIDIANATDTGPLRTQRQEEIANHVHDHFHFHPNFITVVVYGLSADLEWEPYYAPRIRANTFRFSK